MNIVITGAAGYIGSLTTLFLSQTLPKCKITAIDNFMYNQYHIGTMLSSLNNVTLVNLDVNDNEYLLYVKGADLIIPLAAIVGAPACEKVPNLTINTNLHSIKKLINCLSKDQICFGVNTNSGYGTTSDDVVCDENYPMNPISLYAKTKQEAEQIIMDRQNSCVLRFATLYGLSPRLRLDLLVNDFCCITTHSNELILFEGNFKRNFICIKDVVRLFSYIIKNTNTFLSNVFNVGNDDDNMTKYDIAKLICQINKCKLSINNTKKDPDKRNYTVCNKKLYDSGFVLQHNIQKEIQNISAVCKQLPTDKLGLFRNT